jgi:hypothetical protein
MCRGTPCVIVQQGHEEGVCWSLEQSLVEGGKEGFLSHISLIKPFLSSLCDAQPVLSVLVAIVRQPTG